MLSEGPFKRNAPFRLLTALLYAPASRHVQDLGNGVIRIDRLPVARQIRTGANRVREALQWLHDRGYIEILESARGWTTLRLRRPERNWK